RNRFTETDSFREVFGVCRREFLAVEVADRRMGFHDDSRLVVVAPRGEGALDGGDQSILKLLSIFAEIPNVALFVLGVPIQRIFRENPVNSDGVMNFDAGD